MIRSRTVILSATLMLSACSASPEYKTVISGPVGATTVALQAVGGRLVVGDNQVRIRFTDDKDQPVDIAFPKFELKQPAKGGTPAFKIDADLKANGKGNYDATIAIGSQGNWQGSVSWDGKTLRESWEFASMVL
jgi:nitrogen fixation protein FixH